jgi:hypothetical protein
MNSPYEPFDPQTQMALGGLSPGAYIVAIEKEAELQRQKQQQNGKNYATITPPPSLQFVRKTWWDTLLSTYANGAFGASDLLFFSDPSLRQMFAQSPQQLPTRDQISRVIVRDIQYLFKHSNYWFAFINVPNFFSAFFEPSTRDEMQPAFVLALLALSQLLKSSEAQLGARGRERALWLRDKAQAALDASINAQWIDPGLAQAAWVSYTLSFTWHCAKY